MMELKEFQSFSKYERKVDLKKLEFIHKAVALYAKESSRPPESLKVLEAGCGDGSITLPLAALGASVTAFDLDGGLVASVEKEIRGRRLENVSVSKGNLYHIDLDERFDIIIASEVLEHLDHPERVVPALNKHLVNGGYCIITVPNGYGPWEFGNRIKKIISFDLKKNEECGHRHVQFFTRGRLLGLFTENGLEPVAFRKSDILSGLSHAVAKNRVLANADILLADLLPAWLASGWYFVFRNARQGRAAGPGLANPGGKVPA